MFRPLHGLLFAPAVVIACLSPIAAAQAAEIAVLSAENWDAWAPQGKEVDAIYGDIVMRSDRLVAVIAQPVAGRS